MLRTSSWHFLGQGEMSQKLSIPGLNLAWLSVLVSGVLGLSMLVLGVLELSVPGLYVLGLGVSGLDVLVLGVRGFTITIEWLRALLGYFILVWESIF